MALNMDALGKTIGPITKTYTWKDSVLYALGVGAGFDDLDYCYEKNLKVIPSFAIASIFDFLSQAAIASGVNLAGILHGEQALTFHNPIPPEGTLTTTGRLTHYYDKGQGKGALVLAQSETFHSNGQKLFTGVMTLFGRLDGGFGGDNAPAKPVEFPERAPDFVVEDNPSADQPLIYRLSGDVFALHVDPEFARMAGFEKPIMHGLCTHGFACRALIKSLCPGQPELVRRLDCRFSKTLYPGTPIRTLIWQTGPGEAVWRVVNAQNEERIIDNGVFAWGEAVKPQIRFDNRVAIVTGAGGGLGRVYALELARRGAAVVVNDLGGAADGTGTGSAGPADKVVAEILAAGGKAVACYDSVSTAEGGAAIVQKAIEAFGRIDIVINNAGILRDKTFVKMEPDQWQAVLDVHLTGAYNVTRPAFEKMKDQGYGRIVMTTSAAGLHGNFGQANYAAAKMGLVGLMNVIKLEGGKYDIKVNTVAPVAASRLTQGILPPDVLDKMKPEFVAPLVLYLCADQCEVSGRIYNAGMGYFSRAAVVTGPGAVVGDGQTPATVEQVIDALGAIGSLDKAKVHEHLTSQVGDVMAAFESPAAAPAAAAGPATVAAVFEAMPKAFNAAAAAGVDVVFQYCISGAGGGDWHCTVAGGACNVAAGLHAKPTCTLRMAEADFVAMMNKQLAPMQAYTSGKLRIEGDIMKSQLIEKLFKF